jgi:hypothetical protein
MTDAGIPWLTDPQRDFLAHLTVLTLLPQMQRLKPDRGYTYDRMCDALGDIADAGDVKVLGDEQDVYVLIHGEPIVHAARDWLEWAVERNAARKNN